MRRQYHSIQVLRGVAALMVALFHFLTQSFTVGAAGVDIFFVISGFIMGTVGLREMPVGFLYNRAVRIIPLYWVFTIVMCVGSLAGIYSNFTFDAARLAQSLLFIPYRDVSGQIVPLLVVGWTLNLEVFFYVVFAGGLAVRAPLLFTAIVLITMAVIGFFYTTSSAAITLWTLPLLLEFLIGLILSRLDFSGRSLGVIAILSGVVVLTGSNIFHWFDPFYRLLAWGIPAALIVSGALLLEHAGAWPRITLRPLEKIGDASYSLYLTHGFVAAGTHKFISENIFGAVTGLIISVLVAIVVFHFIERPITQFLKRLGKKTEINTARI